MIKILQDNLSINNKYLHGKVKINLPIKY